MLLANHLWQSTLFAALAAGLALMLRNKPRANAICALAGGLGQISGSVLVVICDWRAD